MVGHLVGMLFISYALIYACCFKGLQSSGKMAYVTCLSPYVILGILLIKGITLEGSGKGLNYLFIPTKEKFAKVADANTWKTAATQILFSSGVAYGPFMYYGTARGKNDSLVGASLWIPAANSATSLYAACTIFSFLGHVSNVAGKDIDTIATSGPTLLFVAFPSILNFFSGANFFAIIFFLMAVFLGVDSAFGWVDYYAHFFVTTIPALSKYSH